MMTRLQMLLGILAEECTEIGKVASKAQRFGLENHHPDYNASNAFGIHQELDDLTAVVEMLNEEFNFGYYPSISAMENKREKVNKYAEYSRKLGLLE